MNREIKFRVWDSYKKCWLEDSFGTHCFRQYFINFSGEVSRFDGGIPKSDDDDIYYTNSVETIVDKKNLDPKTGKPRLIPQKERFIIQQFTGLKDKSGKEIYEGDLLETFPAENSRFPLAVSLDEYCGDGYYDEKHYGWVCRNNNGLEKTLIDSLGRKIVGNIFENGDLLK